MQSYTKTVPQRHYDVGYSLYLHRQPLTACHNADMRRGWLAANAAEGEYVTAGYASKAGF